MKPSIKIIVSIMLVIYLLSSCATIGDYYVLTGERKESVSSTLYSDANMFVYLQHFNGLISRLSIINRNNSKDLAVELIKYDHSLSIDNVIHKPSSTRDDKQGAPLNAPIQSNFYLITKIYELRKPPKHVIENIEIELLINDDPIIISKQISLKRKTFNRLQAMWGI